MDPNPLDTAPDERVVRWMPLVVPLMALLLAVLVFLIEALVL